MVDEVKDFLETIENKASLDALERARLARERREVEQKKRLDELRAQAAAAQEQREKREEERRRRQEEQRAKDEDRRLQVEERKRAIWEASVSRREALLQRDRERSERLERVRAARSTIRSPYAFGSSTPRLLDPLGSAGVFWPARSTDPIDQKNFFEAMAASTTNVMYASAPLTRPASTLQLNTDSDKKDEQNPKPQVVWSSVARRRTDLVPTVPAPRAPGRAYSMTRLDKIPPQRPLHSASPSMHHLNRTQTRSGETTPGSRPGSAMSNTTGAMRRAPGTRRSRPASIAGTGVNTPRGGGDVVSLSVATTPSVSRDSSTMAGGDAVLRPQAAPRRTRPVSTHGAPKSSTTNPADGKPPLFRKPKLSKEHDKNPRVKTRSVSPGRPLSPSPADSKETSFDKEVTNKPKQKPDSDKSQVSAIEVKQKLEALQIQNGENHVQIENQNVDDKVNKNEESVEDKSQEKPTETPKTIEKEVEQTTNSQKPAEVQKPGEKKEEKKESSQDKAEENEMTASMTARRITTEEEAKAALAERRRRAREFLEKQAIEEKLRLKREAEEEAERERLEEERHRREEEEARELAQLQRRLEEEKLQKAIEAQQQLEREEAERKAREESERQARLKEEEEKRKAAEEAERLRREEAEREEKERLARKQRVEAIMARTRLRKAEEDKKQQQDNKNLPNQPQQSTLNATPSAAAPTPNNGNVTADLLGLSQQNNIEDKSQGQTTAPSNKVMDNSPNANAPPPVETSNGNLQTVAEPTSNVGHISANFIQTERMASEHSQNKLPENVPKLIEDDFTAHNGHGATHNHPLTLQNAI